MEGAHHQPEGERHDITRQPPTPESTGVPLSGQEHPPDDQYDSASRHPGPDSYEHPEPAVHDLSTAETDLPLTFAQAERRGGFALLDELQEHAFRRFEAEQQGYDRPAHHLAELALSSAVVAWWSRWQPIIMHRALLAGASLGAVAAAAGTSETEAYGRWSAWAQSQTRLFEREGIGLDPAEAEEVRRRLRQEATAEVLALLEDDAPGAVD